MNIELINEIACKIVNDAHEEAEKAFPQSGNAKNTVARWATTMAHTAAKGESDTDNLRVKVLEIYTMMGAVPHFMTEIMDRIEALRAWVTSGRAEQG